MLPLHSLSTLFPYTTLFRSFGPAEYKVFEDDPMHLFTKTGVRISANMRYNPQPWRTPRYMHTHIISANYGFLRRSEEHTSELQSQFHLVCRLLLEKKNNKKK